MYLSKLFILSAYLNMILSLTSIIQMLCVHSNYLMWLSFVNSITDPSLSRRNKKLKRAIINNLEGSWQGPNTD